MGFGYLRILLLAALLPSVAAHKATFRIYGSRMAFAPDSDFPSAFNSHTDTDLEVLASSEKWSTDIGLLRGGARSTTRGTACSDADATVFLKVAASWAVETATLLGVFYAGKEVAENTGIGELFGLPIPQWLSILLVVFGSSFFGSFVDGGLSVATKQALDPNVVPGDPKWYEKLKKPSWNPPGFVFPIMWLIVSKPTQAVALSKVFKSSSSESIPWEILAVYCAHLSLGDAWNKVFFGYQCTGKGAAVITTFFGLLLTSAFLFFGVDPDAGKFMLPTCGWVLIATCLNWNIYLNN